MTDFGDATFHTQVWQERLGLRDWDVRFSPQWLDEDDSDDGNVRYRTDEKVAVLRIHPRVTGKNVERVVVHELIHILLKDYTLLANEWAAKNGESGIAVLDMLHDLEERIANQLATALTGQAWVPTTATARVWYAPWAGAA